MLLFVMLLSVSAYVEGAVYFPTCVYILQIPPVLLLICQCYNFQLVNIIVYNTFVEQMPTYLLMKFHVYISRLLTYMCYRIPLVYIATSLLPNL